MRILCLILLVLCSQILHSQIPKDALSLEDAAFDRSFATRTIPKISGRLLNLSAEELKKTVITYTLVTPFSSRQSSRTTHVAPDGNFQLPLDYAFPYQQVWIGIGELFYAGLYANKDLFVELDMKKIKSAGTVNFNGNGVRYLGTDGPLTAYMNNYVLYKRDAQQDIGKHKNDLLFSKMPVPMDFLMPAYNKLFEEIKKIEDSYIAENPAYAWILENERMSDYYSDLCPRFWNKEMDDSLWQKMKAHKSYLVSNSGAGLYGNMAIYVTSSPKTRASITWKDIIGLPDLTTSEKEALDSLTLIDKTAYATPENMKRLLRKIQSTTQKLLLTRSLDKNIHLFDSLFPPAKADFLKIQLNNSKDPNEQKVALERILASMHTGWSKSVVRSEYKHTLKKIDGINNILASSTGIHASSMPGKPVMKTSFGASMYKVTNMNLRDFLAKLKQNFSGKAIILDRWATWCAPCLSEMPHSKKLQQEAKDMPVVFVYMCTNNSSSESKWKTKVAELQQPGIHFFIDEALDAEIGTYFSCSGYPCYAFIDRAGKYKPGTIQWISQISKQDLSDLLQVN